MSLVALSILMLSSIFVSHSFSITPVNATSTSVSALSAKTTIETHVLQSTAATKVSASVLPSPPAPKISDKNSVPLLKGIPVPIPAGGFQTANAFTPQDNEKGIMRTGASPSGASSNSPADHTVSPSEASGKSRQGLPGTPSENQVGFAGGPDGYCGSPAPCGDVTEGGGSVQHSPTIVILLWDPSFTPCSSHDYDPDTNDCAYASLIVSFFEDLCTAGNPLFAVVNQYTDSSGTIGSCSVYENDYFYYSGSSLPYPSSGYLSDGNIQTAAGDAQSGLGLGANLNTLVMVFVPGYEPSCYSGSPGSSGSQCFDPGVQVNYCAYHSWFYTGFLGLFNPITYAAMPDAASGGCGLGIPSPNDDPYADLVISTSFHEAVESMTDPQPCSGWCYDGSNDHEVMDECAYDYSGQSGVGGYGGLVGTEADGSNVHMGTSQASPGPFEVQPVWSDYNGGCVLDLNGAPTLVSDTLNPDSASGTTAQSWSFPFWYVEAGENSYYSATTTYAETNYIWVTPNYDMFQLPYCPDGYGNCYESGSGYAFCFGQGCDDYYALDTNSYGTTLSFSLYYYEQLEQYPSMYVLDGGTPPAEDISYEVPPNCGFSCAGVADAISYTSTALPIYSSYADIFPVYGSTALVPTCDPSGLVVINNLLLPFCGTNDGAYPSERWDTGICNPVIYEIGPCSEDLDVSGEYAIGPVDYWNQYLVGVAYSTSDGSNLPETLTFYGTQFGSFNDLGTMSNTTSYFWLDYNTIWEISGKATVDVSSTERYHTTAVLDGFVGGEEVISPEFFHQFQVNFAASPSGDGKVPKSGWYDANTAIAIKAKPNSGFKFSSWSSSSSAITFANSKAKSTTMTVTGTGTVTANFKS